MPGTVGATFDGVTVQGGLTLTGSLSVRDGLTLEGLVAGSPGSVAITSAYTSLVAQDDETLDHATISLGLYSVGQTYPSPNPSLGAAAGDTLTLGPALHLDVVGGGILTGQVVNDGLITVENGGTLTVSGSLTNKGSLALESGGVLAVGSSLVGTSPITTAGLLGMLGTVVSNGGTVAVTGTLDNTGQTLDLTPAGSLANLDLQNGGTIQGGTVRLDGGSLQSGYGTGPGVPTLAGVTVQGVLDLSGSARYPVYPIPVLNISSGITLEGLDGTSPGTILLTGSGAQLAFSGSETLDHASVVLGSRGNLSASGLGSVYVGLPTGSSPGTLTLGSQLSADVVGNGVLSGTVVNDGTIKIESGSTLTVSDFTEGTGGTLSVAFGGTLLQAGSITDAALQTLLGRISNQGVVAVTGTFDNTGQTLDLTPASTFNGVGLSGTLHGGTVVSNGGGFVLGSTATLDGVA